MRSSCLILLFLSMLALGCDREPARMDASSAAAYVRSVDAMKRSLPAHEREAFVADLILVETGGLSLDVPAVYVTTPEETEAALKAVDAQMRGRVHGKTVEQIRQEARVIRERQSGE